MLASFLTLLLIVAFVVRMVLPQLVSCVQLIAKQIPVVIDDLLANKELMKWIPEDLTASLSNIDWESRYSDIVKFLASGASGIAGTAVSVMSSLISSVVTWVIALIFAIYLLTGKERLQGQIKRLADTYLRQSWNEKIQYVLSVFNNCFRSFIIGQCTEAVILGTLCIIGMLNLRLPYAVMVGALIGITALIPVAGAYIGAGVGAFMILTVSPIKALVFLIFIIVLQQIEGNVIYPRVVGSSIGLPGIWVLVAVTIGGSISGVIGMLAGVPTAAAIYKMLRTDVQKRENGLAEVKAK